jgi:hypothetical protein
VTYYPSYRVRKRTVNEDGTVTLSALEWIIVGEGTRADGTPLFYGFRIWTPEKSPESPYEVVTGMIELLQDGFVIG